MIIKGLSRIGVFFLYLVSLLPFWLLYIISDFLYLLLYRLAGYRKKVVRENLANSFPEKTENERLLIERQYYHYLFDLVVETIKMFTISRKQVLERMTPARPEVIAELDELFATGRSFLGVGGHYCNWELAALRFSVHTSSIERLIVYKPLSNPIFDKAFKNMRERYGSVLVAMKDITRKLVQLRTTQSFTMLVSDQTPVRESVQYFTTFLNQPTAVFLGVEKLAKTLDSVVIFCDFQCVRRGYYTFDMKLITDEPKKTADYEITNMHVAMLENIIKIAPQYWLWSHRRWKFKPEAI